MWRGSSAGAARWKLISTRSRTVLWDWIGRARRFSTTLRKRARRTPARQEQLAALQESAGSLPSISAALEKQFVATATSLEALNELGREFVRHSEKLVSIAAGLEGGKDIFQKSREVVDQPLRFLIDCHAEAEQLLHCLQDDHRRIAALLRARDDLQRTMAPLKFMQTLFKIESAPLGEEVQRMFTALTRDIEVLHDQVSDLFGNKFLELRQIQHTIEQVTGRLETQSATLWQTVSREKAQVDASLDQLQHELTQNQEREARISRLSTDLSARIRDIIVGLQFQDIISQKLQHTAGALARIREKFTDPARNGAFLHQSCRLEAEQIQAVRRDLAHAESTVRAGIDQILAQLSHANRQCLSLEEFQQITTSSDGMVQTLLEVIESVRKQVHATVAGSAEICTALQPIGTLASGLTVIVRKLSQSIHLIGLNAQVQAALVGNGTGLEILSARTSEISLDTNRTSQAIAHDLDQLAIGLSRNVQAFEELQARALKQQAELDTRGRESEQELHAMRDDALASLQKLHALIDLIVADSTQSLENTRYGQTADPLLSQLQQQLQDLAAFAGPAAAAAPAAAEGLDELQRDYTMASERHVFASVIQNSNPSTPATTPGPTHSIEFFDTPATPPAPAPATAATPTQDLGDNVELF
ncbi:MAG: hypothetical protein U1F98_01335 [Verrucomicrobiota bacterium]